MNFTPVLVDLSTPLHTFSDRPSSPQPEKFAMSCPRCGTELNLNVHEDVVVERCPRCQGVWLDRGEVGLLLARLKGRPTQPDAESLLKRLFTQD